MAIAVLQSKIEHSTWKTLPAYSGLALDTWRSILQKDTFIKELWPAQHLLGKKGVLQGASAVVQMPTSAGKTKSTELILRSAFWQIAFRWLLSLRHFGHCAMRSAAVSLLHLTEKQ